MVHPEVRKKSQRATIFGSARSALVPTLRRLSITLAWLHSMSAMVAKTLARVFTTPSTTIFIGTRILLTPTMSMVARWHKRMVRWCLRMAQADVLPYDFTALADTLHVYDHDVKELLADRQKEAKERAAALQMNAYALTSDPRRPMVAPSTAGDATLSQLRAARQCAGIARQIRCPFQSSSHTRSERAHCAWSSRLSQSRVNAGCAKTHQSARSAASPMDAESDLRSRLVHGIRRQDFAGSSRGHRAEPLRRSHRTDPARRSGG